MRRCQVLAGPADCLMTPAEPSARKARPMKPTRARLTVSPMEDRLVPATLFVNSLFDNTTADAELTLREAIALVNQGGNAVAALNRSLTNSELAQIEIVA